MNIIWNLVFLLILIVNNSHAKNIDGSSGTTDESIVEDCLKIALHKINRDEGDNDDADAKVTNIVCKTRIKDGINIKLSFDRGQQRWECSFYKSFVQTLPIQYEKCTQIEVFKE